jgi:methylase of polypeptide subunit release factors
MTILKLSNAKQEKIDNGQYYNHVGSLDHEDVFKVNDVKVFYSHELDGGGTSFGRRYPHVIRKIYGNRHFERCFEWCSGPGFIGFELLSENICSNLFLADIYPPALAAINKTVINLPKKYQNRVYNAHIKGIADLPTDWKFDLVVANPPHLNHNLGAFITNVKLRDRLGQDLDWNIHREFFNHIGPHLNENAVILLQEHSFASGPIMFESMIEEAGLKIKECYYEKDFRDYYYLEVEKN